MVYRTVSEEEYEQVRVLAEQGMRITRIAKELGVPLTTAQSRVKQLVLSGRMAPMVEHRKKLPRSKRVMVAEFRDRYGINLGSASDLTQLLTKAEMEWLYTCTPKGATVIEFVASIIKDVHAEEVSE